MSFSVPFDASDNGYDEITRIQHNERQRSYYHRHGGIRSKSSRSGKGGIRANLLTQPICAVDGEGKTRSVRNRHDYTLLAASWPDGRTAIQAHSLSTDQCLEFLLDLPEHHTVVGFGMSYDNNMWLRFCPLLIIDRLLDTGKVYWKSYRIEWIERKFFRVRKGKRSVTVYDVLPNWQMSFVKACEAWGVGTPDQLDLIRRMKEQRGNFDDVDDASIGEYCYLECDLLRQLCRQFFDAVLDTPYRPSAVYGPGALAAAAMKHHGIQKYMADLPEPLEELSRYTYFGGRFDCSMFGWFLDAWQYDIKSAYPDQIRYLPCLKHATFEHTTELFDDGVYLVEWECADSVPWGPLPHRDAHGNVFYPYRGQGWYHGIEVQAARELMMQYGGTFNIVNGWHLIRGCEHRPFDFVDELFNLRKTMPYDKGIVIKLILNSLYGKLAQQVGGRHGKRPAFQCLYWAGAITAGTRAKILRGLASSPVDVIGIATDSLVSLRRRDLDIGAELGQWDAKRLSEYAQISNGVYRAIDDSGKEVERSRGLNRGTLNWDSVKRDWVKSKGYGKHRFTAKSRFITLREARMRLDRIDIQCTWVADKRELNFWPARRWPEQYNPDGPTITLGLLAPDDYGASLQSQPFNIKTDSQEVIDARIKYNAYDWQDYA
jgi:DNA polymerase family B